MRFLQSPSSKLFADVGQSFTRIGVAGNQALMVAANVVLRWKLASTNSNEH
jgi:hypothetical protein